MAHFIPENETLTNINEDLKSNRSFTVLSLIGITLLLATIGFINLYSASKGGDFFYSQLKNSVIAVIAFVMGGWLIKPKYLNTFAYLIFGAVCILLVVVLLMGRIAGGSQRWIHLGPISGQPSEFAKIALAIAVARFFYTIRSIQTYTLKDFWLVLGLILLVFGLIFPQPDLGTAGVCFLIGCGQILFLNIDKRFMTISASLGIILSIAAWFTVLHDYQRLRILNLLDPQLDPSGSGYNSLQSLVAVGSGGFLGKGFMSGTQAQLRFLPARHTDFIFSVFAEENGFLGAALVLILFLTLTLVALQIASRARDSFSALLAVGIATFLFVSYMINMAMVLGMFPVVGVPLPFFSHGGTSLIVTALSIGILIGIERESRGMGFK